MTYDADSNNVYKRATKEYVPEPTVDNNHDANVQIILANRLLLLKDPANLCTFCNCIIGFWALAATCQERFYLAMTLIMVGNILDLVDGRIALATPNRHPIVQEFGRMFDPIIEALIANMAPAFVLMRLGDYHIIPVCIAAFFIVVGNFRTGKYFVVGHIREGNRIYYPGMWAEYNLCLMGMIGLAMPLLGRKIMAIVWAVTLLFLCYGMLTTRLRSYRYSNQELKVVLAYCLGLCLSYVYMTLKHEIGFQPDSYLIEVLLLVCHVALAYPCLFKHIEIR